MSWSGFKKNVGRATTQVMMKTGHVEKTADRGYEVEERRYRTLESASLRLQKEAKGYLDSLRAMTASQMRIAETIDAFYGDSGASDGVSRSYKQAVEDLDAETVKALDGPYRLVDIPSRDVYPSGKSRLYHYLANEESLRPYLADHMTDGLDEDLIAEIESEYYSTKRRNDDGKRVVDLMEEFREEYELIDYLCRTTVLEPINRFCAYFPDINECIKKRNNKMLDYDSMRSKVKRLTEKPDKDASKLPRTEKEADMVSLTDFLDEHRTYPPHASLAPTKKKMKERRSGVPDPELASLHDVESVLDEELVMPVPSEPRQSWQSQMAGDAGRLKRSSSVASGWSSNLLARFAEVPSPRFNKGLNRATPTADDGVRETNKSAPASRKIVTTPGRSASTIGKPAQRQRADSKHSDTTLMPTMTSSSSNYSFNTGLSLDLDGGEVASSTDNLLPRDLSSSRNTTTTSPAHRSFTSPNLPSTPSKPQRMYSTPFGPLPVSPELYSSTFTANPRNITPNPFFTPSELHDFMAPLKRAFLKQRANELQQAKAAYEQLNEQLSTELPQLIDLRVPYLDPSFEALVKIQLRFCAEAYSRMAQVQQYLDPQTRDQYANGELDQRVEDVLGQIRELSIAGTV